MAHTPFRICHIDRHVTSALAGGAAPAAAELAAAMGFDHILCQPTWPTPHEPEPDPAGWHSGLRALARVCRDHGLGLWLDLPPELLLAPAAGGAAAGRDRLQAALDCGVNGWRILQPWRLSGPAWVRLTRSLNTAQTGSTYAAWAPGLTAQQVAALAGAGFSAAFSSLPWWNLRDDWYAAEHDRLQRLGTVIAPAADPDRPHHGPDAKAALLRGLSHAVELGEGILMPMPADLADASDPAFVAAAAALTGRFASRTGGQHRLLGMGGGQPWTALLRQSRDGEALLVFNPSAQAPVQPDWELLAARAGIDGASLGNESVPPLAVRAVAPGPAPSVRTAPASAGKPARLRRAMQTPRIIIQELTPAFDDRRHLIKRIVGEPVRVQANVFMDGHDELAVRLLWRAADETEWQTQDMTHQGNDLWQAVFTPLRVGRHEYTVQAWRDVFGTYRHGLARKFDAGLDVGLEVDEGRHLAAAAGLRDAADLDVHGLLGDPVLQAMRAAGPREFETLLSPPQALQVDRRAARYASWYEMFPRSQGEPGRHGTLRDVIARLPYVRDMGFDVLYFPPIHPIGMTNRKGRNNSLVASPDDPGSPYAIGARQGGHDALHPELGTLEDFRALVEAAAAHGLEIALDFAIQCSPDHPWLREHPEWFDWRADGSIRYAENPPKKYEDIVNVDFYGAPQGHTDGGGSPALWRALRDVVLFWVDQGVRTFRVDNPHTKPLPFWQWLIDEVQARHPDAIFLSEAFTRPAMMYRLAAIGFTQSYTYFTWRNSAAELAEYAEEISNPPAAEFFRPHFFVNTPDINPWFLQTSGRAGFLIRAALAATLSGLWGMYSGFEICEAAAVPGKEEYLNSEKYELRWRDWDQPGNIRAEITRLNRIRRDNPALQSHRGTRLLPSANPQVLFYARETPERDNVLLIAVSLDPNQPQETDVELPLWTFGLPDHAALAMEDLLYERSFTWHGTHQRLRLETRQPYGIWRVGALP